MGHAFGDCKRHESVVIPLGLKLLDVSAFPNCPLLKRSVVPKSVTVMTEEDGFGRERFSAEILYGGDMDDRDKIHVEVHRVCMYTHDAKREFSKRLGFYSKKTFRKGKIPAPRRGERRRKLVDYPSPTVDPMA